MHKGYLFPIIILSYMSYLLFFATTQTFKEQLGNDYEFNEPMMMTFNGRGPEPAIKIQLKQQPRDGWNILHKNAKKVISSAE